MSATKESAECGSVYKGRASSLRVLFFIGLDRWEYLRAPCIYVQVYSNQYEYISSRLPASCLVNNFYGP